MVLISNFLLISSSPQSWQELTSHKPGELYQGWKMPAEEGEKCAWVGPGAVTVCSLTALIIQLIAAIQIHPCEIVYVSQTQLFCCCFGRVRALLSILDYVSCSGWICAVQIFFPPYS